MPIDPQIFRDLDAQVLREDPLPPLLDRLVYMGILLPPSQRIYSVKFPQVIQESYTDVRARLLWRPWNRWLVRQALAHDRRLHALQIAVETIALLGSVTPAGLARNIQRLEDIADERRALLGWDWPALQPSGGRRRRRPSQRIVLGG